MATLMSYVMFLIMMPTVRHCRQIRVCNVPCLHGIAVNRLCVNVCVCSCLCALCFVAARRRNAALKKLRCAVPTNFATATDAAAIAAAVCCCAGVALLRSVVVVRDLFTNLNKICTQQVTKVAHERARLQDTLRLICEKLNKQVTNSKCCINTSASYSLPLSGCSIRKLTQNLYTLF